MNLLKEASTAVDFASYCTVLYKGVTDNDTPTPGYVIEEILKISFISHSHRVHLIDFLFTKLFDLSWSGKQKVIKILLHLSQRGHQSIRGLLRQRDGELRKAMFIGGRPDPVLGNTPQLFFNSAVQELLSYIFDQDILILDEDLIKNNETESGNKLSFHGYGSNASQGKYEGFGNSPITGQESIVDQVRDMVTKIALSDTDKNEELDSFLKVEKGSYQAMTFSVALPSISVTVSRNVQSKSGLMMSSSLSLCSSASSIRPKGHVTGKVGGGWGSEDESDDTASTFTLPSHSHCNIAEFNEPNISIKELQSNFIDDLLSSFSTWPLDYERFSISCKEIAFSCSSLVLSEISKRISQDFNQILNNKQLPINKNKTNDFKIESLPPLGDSFRGSYDIRKCNQEEINTLILMLILEVVLNGDLIPVRNFIRSDIESVLLKLFESENINENVKLKAKKIYLIINALKSSC